MKPVTIEWSPNGPRITITSETSETIRHLDFPSTEGGMKALMKFLRERSRDTGPTAGYIGRASSPVQEMVQAWIASDRAEAARIRATDAQKKHLEMGLDIDVGDLLGTL